MEQRKKVAVLGLKDTGYFSALFLAGKGYDVFASDSSVDEDIVKNADSLRAKGIRTECGQHTFEEILAQDWILISPGIPPSSEIYQKIQAAGKPVYSEIEVASWFCKARTIVAVTGSCGKTTIATLIARILKANGKKTVLCGNIGNPWIHELSKINEQTSVVIEVSSFQLAHCASFAPNVGLLLNVFPNHMDWHADMREYTEAKLNLFRRMKKTDVMICRKEDENALFPDFKTAARYVYFDERPANDPNEAALLCAAEVLQCPEAVVRQVLAEFQGLEHRLEKFTEQNGIAFVNDSKSTTPSSLAWAIEKYPDHKVVLICGGKAKSKDFEKLRDGVRQKVKSAILIGAARPLIRGAWNGAVTLTEASDFDHACDLALECASSGDTVLLSPACASFDMFKNYQERGRLFKQKISERLKAGAPKLKSGEASKHAKC